MRKLIFIFFLLIFKITFSVEEIYVSLNVKMLKSDFYPLLSSNDSIYIELNEFIIFLDLKNELEIKDRRYIIGSIEDQKINENIVFEDNIDYNGKQYINIDNLNKILPIKNISFNEEMYSLSITPNFELPYEKMQKILKQRRELAFSSNEDINEKIVYSNPRKFFDLGILSVEYERPDFNYGEEMLTLGYSSQLLYGDFRIDGQVADESELNYVNLDYEDVGFLGGKNVTLGDFYMRTYSAIKSEKNLRGISIYGNETYGRKESGKVIIEGNANGADTVELYQNGILTDFQNVENNSYEFEVRTISSSDEYKVIKYYSNGKTEEKTIYLLSDKQLFSQGEWDYIVQAGQGVDYDENQYMYNLKYGVNNNLTLGGGQSYFKGNDGEEYKLLEGNVLFRTGALKYPSLVFTNILYDTDENEGNIFLNITQKIGDYTFELDYENFEGRLADDNSKDEKYELSFGRNYRMYDYKVRYEYEEYQSENYQEAALDIYYRKQNYRLSTLNAYEIYEDSDNRYSNTLGIDYTGSRYLNVNISTKLEFYDGSVDDSYSIRLSRRGGRNNKVHYLDLAAGLDYNSSDHFRARFEITYYFDSFFRMRAPITIESGENKAGFSIEKTIALKDPIGLQNIKDTDTFWIKGTVFRDSNGNGILDEGEEVLSEVGITASGEEAFTDEEGNFVLQNISAIGSQELRLIRDSIDPTLESSLGEMYIDGRIGEEIIYNIPLIPLSSIAGNINIINEIKDINENLIYSRIVMDILQDGEVKYSIVPEFDGFYILDKILPGEYDIEINYLGSGYEVEVVGESRLSIPKSGNGDFYEIDYNIIVNEIEEVRE